jgi:hypothetical protein
MRRDINNLGQSGEKTLARAVIDFCRVIHPTASVEMNSFVRPAREAKSHQVLQSHCLPAFPMPR